jgi:predicted glycosyltransferase
VSGGRPVPSLAPELARDGVALVQLAPLHSPEGDFRRLVDADGRDAGEALMTARRQQLLATFEAVRPAVVMTEMYPFGRRSLRGEAAALVEAAQTARPRPRLLASVRDLLVAKPLDKLRWMVEAAAPYDAILVHGDPAVLRFEESFPLAGELGDRLRYTGYVATPADASADARAHSEAGRDEVLVSAGGGASGLALLEAALAARPLCPRLGALTWRLLLGPNLPEEGRRRLLAARGPGLIVEPARPDFPALLGRCRLSIGQAGVNTLLEGLAAGARILAVPYSGAGETEQAERARRFADRGWLSLLPEAALSPASLAEAAEAAALRPRPRPAINLDGARHSAAIVAAMAAIVPPAARGEEA